MKSVPEFLVPGVGLLLILSICIAALEPVVSTRWEPNASNIDDYTGLSCQTDSSSPGVGDATACSTTLISLGNQGIQCCQTDCSTPAGYSCTTMLISGSAATDICGNCGACVPCDQAGNSLGNIISNCASASGQVSGYIFGFTDPSMYVSVYHA